MVGSTRRRFVTAFGLAATVGSTGRVGVIASTASRSAADSSSWETGSDLPDERTEVKAAALEGRYYVFGGFVPPAEAEDENASEERTGVETKPEAEAVTDGVAVYDPSTESWSDAAPMPRPRHHVSVAVVGDRIYVIGGYEGGFDPVDSVLIYDGETWERGASMPTSRGALAAGVVDDRIYVVGGVDGDGALATLEVYDPREDSWEEGPAMPTAREHLTAGVVDGVLYAIGGRRESANVGTVEAYEPETDEWTAVSELPTPRSGLDATVVDEIVYAFGGESAERTFDAVEAYHPDADRWESIEPMPTARHGLGTAAIDGDVYVASGGPEPGFSYSSVLEVLRFEEG